MHPYTARPMEVAAPLFRERLVKAMAGITIRDLATRSGVNPDTINSWRKGAERPVTVDLVRKVAAVLGTTAEQLLDLPDDPQPTPANQTRPQGLLPAIDRAEVLLKQATAALEEARRAGSD
jgi:transcriptional regulator with XRE-family HTH domain